MQIYVRCDPSAHSNPTSAKTPMIPPAIKGLAFGTDAAPVKIGVEVPPVAVGRTTVPFPPGIPALGWPVTRTGGLTVVGTSTTGGFGVVGGRTTGALGVSTGGLFGCRDYC